MKRYKPTLCYLTNTFNLKKLAMIIFCISVFMRSSYKYFFFCLVFLFVVIGRERLEMYIQRQGVLYGNEYMEQPV